MQRKSLSAFSIHACGWSASLIENLPLAFGRRDQRISLLTLSAHFVRRVNDDVHWPISTCEQGIDLHRASARREITFKFDEDIQITVGPIVTTRAAAEKDDATWMHGIDYRSHDL